MKNKLSVFLLGIALVTMQACGSKTENNETAEVVESPAVTVALTSAERRAKAEKARVELAEQRRLAFVEMSRETPFYKLDNGKLIYNKAETSPSYVGGDMAMNKFLEDNNFPQFIYVYVLQRTLYSTVTDFAKFLGLSISQFFNSAT